jgi:His Kinase A (phospho-acceptor) domain
LSNSKSKTQQSSKTSLKSKARARAKPVASKTLSGKASPKDLPLTFDLSAAGLAIGHQPTHALSPQDEALFRAFQSNLLSLISHELRTPLMGVLNSMMLLEESPPGISAAELITMARRNAQRLHRSLSTILDVAAIESQGFRARLREVDLAHIVRGRVDQFKTVMKDRGIDLKFEPGTECVILADPLKIGRAVDLCLEMLALRAKEKSSASLRISSTKDAQLSVTISGELMAGAEKAWDQAWAQSVTGFEGGVASPGSAFAGVMQSEQAFLSRMEEGLGSELLLVHEIMRLHDGKFVEEREAERVTLELRLPLPNSTENLRRVLASRAADASDGVFSVALILLKVPKAVAIEKFRSDVKKLLYRGTDGVYPVDERGEVAIVMEDYQKKDLPKFIERLEKSLGGSIRVGMAHCPEDVAETIELLEKAQSKLK